MLNASTQPQIYRGQVPHTNFWKRHVLFSKPRVHYFVYKCHTDVLRTKYNIIAYYQIFSFTSIYTAHETPIKSWRKLPIGISTLYIIRDEISTVKLPTYRKVVWAIYTFVKMIQFLDTRFISIPFEADHTPLITSTAISAPKYLSVTNCRTVWCAQTPAVTSTSFSSGWPEFNIIIIDCQLSNYEFINCYLAG